MGEPLRRSICFTPTQTERDRDRDASACLVERDDEGRALPPEEVDGLDRLRLQPGGWGVGG